MAEKIKEVESKINSIKIPQVGKSVTSEMGNVKFVISKDLRNTHSSEDKIYDYNLTMYNYGERAYSGSFPADSNGWNKVQENMRTRFNTEYAEMQIREERARRKAMRNKEKSSSSATSSRGIGNTKESPTGE